MEKRLNEILERMAAIKTEIESADEERMTALEAEVAELETEELQLRKKMEFEKRITKEVPMNETEKNTAIEERAKQLKETGSMKINARALLVGGGTIALATTVDPEIKDIEGPEVSSLVDLVDVEDCTGMGTYRIPYEAAGMTANAETEGSAGTASDVTFGYVDLTPNDYDALCYISKQIRKQSPVQYEAKVRKAARTALRKKVSKTIVDAVVASSLAVVKEVATNAVGATTLRDIALAYGGDEGVGAGVLILNKADLIAFGAVRGTNEKKAVYEITPDAADANRGTIRDGGLVVPYILNSNVKPLSGATANDKTMLYGSLKNIKLGLWDDVEVKVSEDYKFAEGLLTVRGETLCDADLVVKNGFVVVKYATA